jgi:UrcA family protein
MAAGQAKSPNYGSTIMKTLNHNTMMTAITLSLALLFASAPIMAQPTIRISLKQVDFSNSQQVADLYKRIQAAAQKVCYESAVSWSATNLMYEKECVGVTVDKAVQDINRPELSALNRTDTKRVASH